MKLKEFSKRLSKARILLKKKKIIFERKYECCNTCANFRMVNEEMKEPHSIVGGIYIHCQEEARLKKRVKDGLTPQVYVGFLLTSKDENEAIELVRNICATICEAGLSVSWNGDLGTKILIYFDGDSVDQ